jgi:UDP-GlcNAc:undecaprenyl-phosphate GlcNAc-1-phosphate transferase
MAAALVAFVVSLAVCAAFVKLPSLSAALTRVAAQPRWRMDAVPLAGGMAMGAGFGIALLIWGGDTPGSGAVAAGAFVGLAFGLWDDLRPLPPIAKLAGQAAAGVALVGFGLSLDLPGGDLVSGAATVLWVVVAMNAVNLVDNMDAAAGGMALIAAGALWIWWAAGTGPVVLVAALGGAIVGFLALNLPPARVFMGDAGSHFLGAAIAGLAVLDAGRAGTAGPAGPLAVIGVPIALLAVPLFDTAFVDVDRLRHGRPVSVGGSDHTAHRLARRGLSVSVVVAILWSASLLAAAVGSLAAIEGPWLLTGLVVLAALAAFAWRHLSRIEL